MNKLVFFQLSLFCFFLVTFSFSNYAVGIEVPRNPNEKKKEDKPPPKPDLGKAAMSVAKAVANPKQLAFVAIGTVVQAAMKAYNAMKDRNLQSMIYHHMHLRPFMMLRVQVKKAVQLKLYVPV